MNREEKKEYTAFVNSMKKQLLKGAVVEVTGLEEKDHCPECDQPFGDLPWIAVRGNGVTDPPVCSRCATSE